MISIVIPTFNEAACIKATLLQLQEKDTEQRVKEIIISDGGSTDATETEACAEGVLFVKSPKKGRAAQMNFGARHATQSVIYFLHADTLPPNGFAADIKMAVDNGFDAGCFMLQFSYNHWFLKANCWFTRFNVNAIRFGDQSLFVTKKLFQQSGGFNESHIVMEDQEIIKRLRKAGQFTVIKKPVITSARKYLVNGIYRTQAIFFLIYFMYYLGYSQTKLVATYRKLMRQDKV